MKLADMRITVLDIVAMPAFFAAIAAVWLLAGGLPALWTVCALVANHVIGTLVYAFSSSDNQIRRLSDMVDSAPSAAFLITQAWPVIIWLRLRMEAK